MIEQVYEKIYRCEIPLPENPLKVLNSYIIKGKDKAVIIDTGFNSNKCKEAFYHNLNRLDIDIRKTEVIVTHLHADHSGLAHELYRQGAKVFMSKGDGNTTKKMKEEKYWIEIGLQLKSFGLKVGEDFFDTHPGKIYAPSEEFDFTPLKEGSTVVVDEYRFQVISVPGHTPDMINLYEPKHEVYFSADHVLDPITPNIAFWGFEYPLILNQYFQSLKKIYSLKIKLMLPSHRKLIMDHKKRIDELLVHHQHRLQEIETILAQNKGDMTVEGVAKEMEWKILAKDWDAFPPPQKSFAVAEAMSHLEYLAHKERVHMSEKNGLVYFRIMEY
ncbi:Glyoxylase, beta-lactamase superfamily II [Anaerovirgula multivorans]|uniref:Glyoxylase, beta-lactamase superfamily II n=1 Tax=Anaerovirgula multivorans TaxID=312168 RepID=A0A239LE03_9FIRM|nr:MBL fold metallo-hydrolase [Anaerovirgula multivorans]SNT28162.1 Glyoxylase, beta-lactamase superfamily II [Anaerovirgula multivorans]